MRVLRWAGFRGLVLDFEVPGAGEDPGGDAEQGVYVKALPSALMYEKSYMHIDTVSHVRRVGCCGALMES